MLEAFSRTVRTYVPSSIPIPSASPAPPRVSRPLSVGSFLPPTDLASPPASPAARHRAPSGITTDWRARTATTSAAAPAHHYGAGGALDDVFGSDEEDAAGAAPALTTRTLSNTSYPGLDDGDAILWARWDQLKEGAKQLLFLGYAAGLQVWDCTRLASVSELLNLSNSEWGRVAFAGVLPPPASSRGDAFAGERPLIGMV